MMYPLVLDLADDGFPVSVTCRVLGFSTQAFNKWRRNPVSRRDWDEAHLINAAMDIHSDDPAFGYRFISDELADAGHVDSERRVWRICSQQRIFSAFAKKKGMRKKAGPPVHDDLVRRNFSAPRANELWLTDITEHRTDEGKLYLCAIKDCFSNRIVGYSIKDRMTSSLAVAALRNAVGLRSPFGTTIIHSDRGSISIQSLRRDSQAQPPHRLDGPGRSRRRQCLDGVLLLTPPAQRARPPALGDT
jgi:transposase InsO family protein